LDLRERKWLEVGEDYITRNFIISANNIKGINHGG
jgi:hypothetical protein